MFTEKQMCEVVQALRKEIFYLLLIVDPKTKDKYKDVNVRVAINNEIVKIEGLNDLLGNPQEIVWVLSLLESARKEYCKKSFRWSKYRKLILDAGAEVLKIKGV